MTDYSLIYYVLDESMNMGAKVYPFVWGCLVLVAVFKRI